MNNRELSRNYLHNVHKIGCSKNKIKKRNCFERKGGEKHKFVLTCWDEGDFFGDLPSAVADSTEPRDALSTNI